MATRITSLQNQRVKEALRLRDHRGREEQNRIIIDGAREIARAMESGVQIAEVFAVVSATNNSESHVLLAAEQSGATIYDISPAILKKLAYGDRDTGLIAVAEPPRHSLCDLRLSDDSLVVVLESVEKPGNVGAVVRSADATSVCAVLIADGGTDVFNPNAIRASAGALFSLPIISASGSEILSFLRAERFHIYATRVDANRCYWDVSFAGRVALVLGSESSGLSPVWSGPDIASIALPQHGIADSLNVSVTAAVLLYEALRQREGTPGKAGSPGKQPRVE